MISGVPGAGGQREVIFNLRAQVDPRSQKAFEDFKRANGQAHLSNGRAAKKVADDQVKFEQQILNAQLRRYNESNRALARISADAVRMQERAADQIARAQERAALKQIADHKKVQKGLEQIAGGALAAARGIALFAVSSEKDLERLLEVLIKIEAAFAVLKGGATILKGLGALRAAGGIGAAIGGGIGATLIGSVAAPIAFAAVGEENFNSAYNFFSRSARREALRGQSLRAQSATAYSQRQAEIEARPAALQAIISAAEQQLTANQKILELQRTTSRERIAALEDERSRVRALADAEKSRLQSAAVAFGQLGPAQQAAAQRLATRARFGGRFTRRESERLRALGLTEFEQVGNEADIERARRAGFDSLARDTLGRIETLQNRQLSIGLDIRGEQRILVNVDASIERIARETAIQLKPFRDEWAAKIAEKVRETLQQAGFDPRSAAPAQERFNAG